MKSVNVKNLPPRILFKKNANPVVNHIPLDVLHSLKNERTSPEPFYERLCEKHISEYAKFGMFLH